MARGTDVRYERSRIAPRLAAEDAVAELRPEPAAALESTPAPAVPTDSEQTAFTPNPLPDSPGGGWFSKGSPIEGLSLGTNISTLGVGLEAGYRLNDYFGLRLVGSYFLDDLALEFSGVEYDADLTLLSAGAVLDFYPFREVLRLSGGIRYNRNSADVQVTPTHNIHVGGLTLTPEQIGRLDGEVRFRSYAPYAGFGLEGSWFEQRLVVAADFGVFFQGSPDVELEGGGALAGDPRVRAAVAREVDEIEDDLSFLGFYPVVHLSATYRF